MKETRILIVAGGTGGHITPGIALYEEFREKGVPVLFLSGKNDVRFSLLNTVEEGDLLLYDAPKLTKNPFKIPFFLIRILGAFLAAKKIIRARGVTAVIGMGGYTTGPALLAAKRSNIPIYLCEQNTVPGKVTRLFEKTARRIYSTFDATRNCVKIKEKVVHAGNPIRKGLLVQASREEAKKAFHLQQSGKVIFAIGGSQGAVRINELVLGLKQKFAESFKNVGFIWSTGDFSYKTYKEKMQACMDEGSMYLSPFIAKVGLAYRACDIAISRSGAGVMMELAAMGVPSLQIPFPYAAMNHQEKNADVFEKEGAAVKVRNEDATPEKVAPILLDLLNNPRTLKKMSDRALALARIDASSAIVNDVLLTEEQTRVP